MSQSPAMISSQNDVISVLSSGNFIQRSIQFRRREQESMKTEKYVGNSAKRREKTDKNVKEDKQQQLPDTHNGEGERLSIIKVKRNLFVGLVYERRFIIVMVTTEVSQSVSMGKHDNSK